MITALIALAASGVPYGAPSEAQAYQAFTDRYLTPFRAQGRILRELNVQVRPDFPAHVTPLRCAPRTDYTVSIVEENDVSIYEPVGFENQYDGHFCVIEVTLNGAPPFRTSGFFYYDGVSWAYSGPTTPRAYQGPQAIELDRVIDGFDTKPGSLNYDGFPNNPFNEGYDPYEAISP